MTRTELYIGGAIVLLLAVMMFLAVKQDRKWEEFIIENNCVVVERISGSTSLGTGVSSSGQVVTMPVHIAAKTAYKCDDGVTYWR